MMKRVVFFLLFAFVAITSLFAQQISVSEAMSRAQQFLQKGNAAKGASVASASPELSLSYTQMNEKKDKVCFYAFNKGTNNGFIIMGGDEAAQTVLGYCDNGTFDYATAPENFKWWLSQYTGQISNAISYAEAHPDAVNTAKAKGLITSTNVTSKSDISPLLGGIEWDQIDPYNSSLPSLGSGYTGNYALATGCVATAMAQVMKYHNYPTSGSGSKTYTKTWSEPIGTITFSADFANTTYDWNKMINSYKSSYSDAEKTAVATLMYHCGVAVNMNYGQISGGGSGASNNEIAPALVNYFKYNNAIRFVNRNYINDETWETLIYNELANSRPVIYTGNTTSGSGHAFVCDGYRSSDDTYDINWGWSGAYNGYFKITGTKALTPDGTGTGGSAAGSSYNQYQTAIINIIATAGGNETPVLYNYTGTMTLNDGISNVTTYTHNHGTSKTITLNENVWNQSRSLTSITFGVKATDTTTGLEYYFAGSTENNFSVNAYGDLSQTFDVNNLPYNGTYQINMVGRNANSTSENDWYEVGVNNNIIIPTVTITGASDPQKTDVSFTIDKTSVQVSRTLQISHTTSYKGSTTYTSSDNTIATTDANGIVTGVKEGTVTITAHAAGNTYFNETTQQFTVKVTKFIKDDIDVTISATGIVVGGTAQITVTSGYDGTISYESSNTSVATVADGVVTGRAAGTATITVTVPATDKYNEKITTFDVIVSEAGLIFSEAPYFSNDNNIWENDMVLHIPLYNGTSSTFNDNFWVQVQLGSNSGVTYTCNISNFASGASCDYTINLSNYKTNLSSCANSALKIEFYRDDKKTEAFNIPNIIFKYRTTLSYDYTLTAAGIGTLILPFNAEIPTVDNSNNSISWKAYECNNMDGNSLVLTEATTLKRNTPYIITGTAATCTFTGPNAVDASPVLFGNGVLKGTMLSNTYQFKSGDYILQNQNNNIAFYKYTDNGTDNWKASQYHAFIQNPNSGSLYVVIPGITDNTPTAIDNVSTHNNNTRVAGIYSINGQKLTQLQPGLNIIVDTEGKSTKVFVNK